MDYMKKVHEIEHALCGPGGYFETEETQVLGERMRVFKNRAPSLRALVETSAGFGEKEYIVYNERRITYADHFKAAASVAKALQDKHGVKKGDRVAVLAANNPEWIITFWAAVSLGAIAVGLNGWWVADEILYGLDDSQPNVLIGDEKRLARLNGIDVPVPVVKIETDFDELINYAPEADLSTEPIAEDDPACILYTSGTTGRPKGAVNSHRNIIALLGIQIFHGLRQMQLRGLALAEAPASLVTSPLFHVSGLHVGAIIGLATGIKTVWMEGRFDPVKAMQLIEKEKITNWGPMGTAAHRFVNHPDVKKFDLSCLTTIGSGGAPMPGELQESLRSAFPNAADSLALGYGLTECTALATMNFGEEFKQKPLSSGRPLPTIQIEIRDMNGKPVGLNTDGEIYTRSPLVMLEYWQLPEETAKTIVDGRWLATGDIGKIDEDGHLIINSRARDLILRGSENIYPIEIEHRIAAHPEVAEVAVIGVDHKELGQEVKAVIVPEPGKTINSEELAKWVGETLAYYKVPAHWEIRKEPLPRNAVGKVMKHLLENDGENPFAEE
jgi:acyl-CoA synthetase (AMP-forming)/AMP-acid ligase II